MLEKGMNPKTKQPVTPTLPALKKLAEGMCMTLTDLLAIADDIPIGLRTDDLNDLGKAKSKELSPPDQRRRTNRRA